MNLLCIDTSTKNLSLAVSNDERVIKDRNTILDRPLDRSLMPGINKILNDAGMSIKELDGIAVGLGPGSFTSLRVGLSTVKGLAFAAKKPVVGVSSLDILAMNVRKNTQVCTVCDAKRSLVYACLYERSGPDLRRKSDYLLTSIQEALKKVRGEVTFIGDGLELYKDHIRKMQEITPEFAQKKYFFPQARCLVPLVLERFKKGEADNIGQLVPMYLYPDHCQIKKN